MKKLFALIAIMLFSVVLVACDTPDPIDEVTTTGITIFAPTKTVYNIDDTIDLTGMVVKAQKSDGTEVALTSTDFQVSTFNSSTAGVKTLTVSYLTFSRTFTVTVNPAVDPEATVIDIIITPPTKLIYQLSETINTAGLIVKKNMSDSTQLTLASSEYTITGFETLTAGTKTITITYGEFSKTFTITVETGNGGTDPDWNWDFNQIAFDGKGMNVVVKVGLTTEYDPFDANFSGTRKTDRQAHQRALEAAYNIKLVYQQYGDEAAWGPTRVNAIIEGHIQNNRLADIYLLASAWVPTIAKTGAIVPLQEYFLDYEYEQARPYRQASTYRSQVYGFSPGEPRPDMFMYFNVDLLEAAGLPNPAQMWLDGTWTWSNFMALLQQAHNSPALNGKYAFGGDSGEVVMGMVTSHGYNFINPVNYQLLLASPNVYGVVEKVQSIKAAGYWEPSPSQVVSNDFKSGNTLFSSGDLWFLGSSMRFSSDITFEIGAVPYPTRDGDGVDKLFHKLPILGLDTMGIANIQNGQNGLNSEILFSILFDLYMGMAPANVGMSSDEVYRTYLEGKFDSELYVDAIMSVQDPAKQYFELVHVVSMSIGNGSHWTNIATGFYPLMNRIVYLYATNNARVSLDAVAQPYRDELVNLGYTS